MENNGDFFSQLGYESENLTDSEKVDILRQLYGSNLEGISVEQLFEALDTFFTEEGVLEALNMLTYEAKISALDMLTDDVVKVYVIMVLPDDKKIEMLDKLTDDWVKVEVIKALSDDKKVEMLDKLTDDRAKAEVIKTLPDDKKIEMLDKLTDDWVKVEVIKALADDKKIVALDKLTDDWVKVEVIKALADDKKIVVLDKLTDGGAKTAIIYEIKTLPDYAKRKIEDKLVYGEYKDGECTRDIILLLSVDDNEKVDLFIQYCLDFKLSEEEIVEKKEILLECMKNNTKLLKTINLEFLDKKYIEIFGQGRFEQIACYPETQAKIVQLDDTKLEVLKRCIEKYVGENGEQQWNVITSRLLDALSSDQFEELLSDVGNVEKLGEEEIDLLIPILTTNNVFNIRNMEEAGRVNEIKQEVCEAIIAGDEETLSRYPQIQYMYEPDRKRTAILEMLFNIDIDTAERMLKIYGQDIENIDTSDPNSKICVDYINLLKFILEEKDEEKLDDFVKIAREVSQKIPNMNITYSIAMEGEIKNAYFKEYKKDLLKIEDARNLDGRGFYQNGEDGENIYEAGLNFNILLTSVQAYLGDHIEPENFYEDWNRASKSAQGICTSYIRHDMMGTAFVPFCCLGFCSIDDESLMLSGASDIASDTKHLEPTASDNNIFLTPNEQINRTFYYNEMVINRTDKNENKVQPDYIVAFRRGGVIIHEDTIRKVQEDFGGIPIVVIDVDKCLVNEEIKVLKLLKDYLETGNEGLREEILQKIRNNEQTTSSNAINNAYGHLGDFARGIPEGLGIEGITIEDILNNPMLVSAKTLDARIEAMENKLAEMQSETRYAEEEQSQSQKQCQVRRRRL